MFSHITDMLNENGRGIHAYRSVATTAYREAVEKPDLAAAYYLLATAAEAFVEEHERMPLSAHDLKKSFTDFEGYVSALQAAFDAGETDGMLAALNKISIEIVKARKPAQV